MLNAQYALNLHTEAGALAACGADVSASAWLRMAEVVRAEGGRLVAIWGSDRGAPGMLMSAVYCVAQGLLWLRLPVGAGEDYPDLSAVFPAATRMQRAVYDLLGLCAAGVDDARPWLNHGRWPADYFPLQQHNSGREQFDLELEQYHFVSVAGDGVHEIGVGPVHAGIIEPGHFRFSVVGEKVLRLEQRFGYTHKGTEKLFAGMAPAQGARLAARVSGDSTVAFTWAYCMAAEAASGCVVPARAAWLRALLLERERIANHLGDLGALGNDCGLALGLAQFSLLKEDWVRLNDALFGHRFMMDCIVPGGCAVDIDGVGLAALRDQCARTETTLHNLRAIYEGHAGLQDRFIGAGRVTPALAAQLGLCGMAGRASGQAFDARADAPIFPYDELVLQMATSRSGDVAARVAVRFDEIDEALRLLRAIAGQISAGPVLLPLPAASPHARALGWVEGWRGAVLVGLELDGAGAILRCHCHDPSWHNWPVLQHAIMDNIVPDFPLINKSFNLSYSGSDL